MCKTNKTNTWLVVLLSKVPPNRKRKTNHSQGARIEVHACNILHATLGIFVYIFELNWKVSCWPPRNFRAPSAEMSYLYGAEHYGALPDHQRNTPQNQIRVAENVPEHQPDTIYALYFFLQMLFSVLILVFVYLSVFLVHRSSTGGSVAELTKDDLPKSWADIFYMICEINLPFHILYFDTLDMIFLFSYLFFLKKINILLFWLI